MIQFKLEDDSVYAGSRLFAPLADKVGIPIDKASTSFPDLLPKMTFQKS